MPAGRDQIVREIEISWSELKAVFALVKADRLEGPAVIGNWTVKDLLGHVATWEAEVMGNIERFMDPQVGTMRPYPDVDGFNDRTVEGKRSLTLDSVTRDLDETHTKLLEFLAKLPDSAFHQERVDWRLRLDTYEHYREHAKTLRDWLNSSET